MWSILCGLCHLLTGCEGALDTWPHRKAVRASKYVSGLSNPANPEDLRVKETPAISKQMDPEASVMVYTEVDVALFPPLTRPWKLHHSQK